MDNIKIYSDLVRMQKVEGNAEKVSRMSAKVVSTCVASQFVTELMKDLKMGGDFDFLFIDAITEAIVRNDGFGTDRIFNQNYKKSRYANTFKETDNASIDLSI